jgi:pimeloyl-ACP methyl ester carboxylesterase
VTFHQVLGSIVEWDWRPRLASLDVPTLVVQGAEDAVPLAASRDWAATLPDARLLVIPAAGHFPWAESPETFFPAVDQFLDGRWPDGARRVRAVTA